MAHDEVSLALDGNAAAGLMQDCSRSTSRSARATCDAAAPSASPPARVYAHDGCDCPLIHCSSVVIRLAKTPAGYFLDMQGARSVFRRALTPLEIRLRGASAIALTPS